MKKIIHTTFAVVVTLIVSATVIMAKENKTE